MNPLRGMRPGIIAVAACVVCSLHAQEAKPPLAFETASVKMAPADAQPTQSGLMLPSDHAKLPRGLWTLTWALPTYVFFAEGLDEPAQYTELTRSMPAWTQQHMFTMTARIEGEPSRGELQQMMHTLLVERFALQVHRETHDGPVERLIQIKPGTPGPSLKPHPADEACDPGPARFGVAPSPGKPAACGVVLYRSADGLLHLVITDTTLAEAARTLGGLAGQVGGRDSLPIVDGTGLPGRWDMTLAFRMDKPGTAPDALDEGGGGPTFTGAVEHQLGLKLVKGTGPVHTLVVDHIAEPTPD